MKPSPPAAVTLPERWVYSAPLIAPEPRAIDASVAQKDPTVVRADGRWHVFMTVKLPGRSAIEYAGFDRWEEADAAPRALLTVSESRYFCAPQVFFFEPHRKWYLVYQVGGAGTGKMQVAFSTTETIGDPASWTPARPILDGGPGDPRPEGGLDYWIICDEERAYLFFTASKGKLWRFWTRLEDFPRGFGHGEVALRGPFFEAAHIYRAGAAGPYLAIIEEDGRRYYKAWTAERLDGAWTPLADTPERPFAGWRNVRPAPGVEPWTDNVSHGELVRAGVDQRMIVDPARWRFVFQGLRDEQKSGLNYGRFPWRIGILAPAGESPTGMP